ncbi:MAG: FprA family A-type flavoprotein [Candidatus Nezhaarchaeota archaeon]|nr:FprA family A-type flavoprotein [Candidatus Nezhaarchaeota archaeon]
MAARGIVDGVFYVGVDDLELDIFESIWPLPHGISYNSYLVTGSEGSALIDTVDSRFSRYLMDNVVKVLGSRKLDYVVLNHLEQDHSGSLPVILEVYPDVTVVGTMMALKLARNFYGEIKRCLTVKDGDAIDLGGKVLKFIQTPWLHWPETMMTYLVEGGVLFSCDAFGSFGALRGKLFDDEVEADLYLSEAKRYFSNIVAPVSSFVLKAIDKVKSLNLDVRVVAPSHGPIYRSNPARIIELYANWSKPLFEAKVVIAYCSMYGSVKRMANEVAAGVEEEGVKPIVIDAARTHLSYVLKEVIDAPCIAIGFSTYDGAVHPASKALIDLLTLKKVKNRSVGIFMAYGWSSNMHKIVADELASKGNTIIEPIIAAGVSPTKEDFKLCRELGRRLGERAIKH